MHVCDELHTPRPQVPDVSKLLYCITSCLHTWRMHAAICCHLAGKHTTGGPHCCQFSLLQAAACCGQEMACQISCARLVIEVLGVRACAAQYCACIFSTSHATIVQICRCSCLHSKTPLRLAGTAGCCMTSRGLGTAIVPGSRIAVPGEKSSGQWPHRFLWTQQYPCCTSSMDLPCPGVVYTGSGGTVSGLCWFRILPMW